jgi:protein-ribulosamine 3-kinase
LILGELLSFKRWLPILMNAAVVRAILAREFPGVDTSSARVRREHGGCSDSACFRVDLPGSSPSSPSAQSLFVKVSDNPIVCDREAHGLRALAATVTIRVPHVHSVGRHGNMAYLILEFLTLRQHANDYAALGTALGRLHAAPASNANGDARFGLDVDNFLGATPQQNMPRQQDWVSFFRTNRLEFQLNLLRRDRGVDPTFVRRVQHVMDCAGQFFDPDEKIQASLLHGDLWQGNWGFTEEGEPVVFDPACYYGHSEAELAMMTLFGSLPASFYKAYETHVPRARRFADRVPLYQLYHALNHYTMFGAGYKSLCDELLTQLESTISKASGPATDARRGWHFSQDPIIG